MATPRSAPGIFFQQVTAQQADVSQPWAQSLELYITPWGFLKGAAANNATAARRNVDGESYTVLSWSPTVKAASGKAYTINGYVNADNLVERVETWLGENIMGDMHIVAKYSDWRDFGGGVQCRRGSSRRAAVGRSSRSTWRTRGVIRPISRRWRRHAPPPPGGAPAAAVLRAVHRRR